MLHPNPVRSLPAAQREHWRLVRNLDELATDWTAAAPPDNVFLRVPFLRALAAASPPEISTRYAVYYRDTRPVGVVLIQLITFHAASNIKTQSPVRGLRQNVFAGIRGVVSRKAAFRTLTCGNFLLSGQHGFYFSAQEINPTTQYALVERALSLAQADYLDSGQSVDGLFIKDIESKNATQAQTYYTAAQFHEVGFQPNMTLSLPENWHSRADYLADMSSKYRVRARKAAKAATEVRREVWTFDRIRHAEQTLHTLYRSVSAGADFSLFQLPANYFTSLATQLGDGFRLTAYTLHDEPIGFRTEIRNGDTLEAHFLGYDPAYRRSHQLYLNMLYDLAEAGIHQGCRTVVYGRTALEIKSTVGAAPEALVSFLRHDKRWANCLLPRVFDYLAPKIEWTQRRPFKTK